MEKENLFEVSVYTNTLYKVLRAVDLKFTNTNIMPLYIDKKEETMNKIVEELFREGVITIIDYYDDYIRVGIKKCYITSIERIK